MKTSSYIAILSLVVFFGAPVAFATAQMNAQHAIWFITAYVLYWLPCGVAIERGHRNWRPILIVNLLLGWTVIGWVVALAWAYKD